MEAEARVRTRREAVDSFSSAPSGKRRRGIAAAHRPHPIGVKPAGNALTDNVQPATMGLLSYLPEALLWSLLEQLSGPDLARASRACRALYAWALEEELWKLAVVGEFCRSPEAEVAWQWAGSWRRTYVQHQGLLSARIEQAKRCGELEAVKLSTVFSDYLYSMWRTVSAASGPWLTAPESVTRLTCAEFAAQGASAYRRPAVLTDAMLDWPAMYRWSKEQLLQDYGEDTYYINSGVRQRLREYMAYADTQRDELPVYLFDHTFGEAHPAMLQDFCVPALFNEDLFQVLGAKERPNHRWLLIGPARAGATFHLDPHHTSAWNGVIRGSKKWVFYPPHVTPPGVYPSADGQEVRAPLSIVDWFQNFYNPSRGGPAEPLEVIQRQGEMVYVPSGWWHCVLNLEESIALTQNFVDTHNLRRVMAYLASKPSQGLKERFITAMKARFPNHLTQLAISTATSSESSSTGAANDASAVRTTWSAMRADAATPFKFGFST